MRVNEFISPVIDRNIWHRKNGNIQIPEKILFWPDFGEIPKRFVSRSIRHVTPNTIFTTWLTMGKETEITG